jgi:hypothetical protein
MGVVSNIDISLVATPNYRARVSGVEGTQRLHLREVSKVDELVWL